MQLKAFTKNVPLSSLGLITRKKPKTILLCFQLTEKINKHLHSLYFLIYTGIYKLLKKY